MANHFRTREEELWWCAPWIWRRREVILESLATGEDWCKSCNPEQNHPYFSRYNRGAGLSPVGDLLPYLFFASDGWTLGDWRYLDHKKEFFRLDKPWRFGWVETLRHQGSKTPSGQAIRGQDKPILSPIDQCLWVLPDPRKINTNSIAESDDTKRVCRLIQACFEQLVCDEPHIASLWIEDGELLCGWEPLPKKDARCIKNLSNWHSSDPKPRIDDHGKRILRHGWHWEEATYPGVQDDRGLEARRRQRVKETAEVFTPLPLTQKMLTQIPEETKSDRTCTMLDNSCGDGNFLVSMLHDLSKHHHANHALNNLIYGVDLQSDNVKRARLRLGLTPDMPGWQHIVCADALKYDYSFIPKDDLRLSSR
jgi:hypothetical protein